MTGRRQHLTEVAPPSVTLGRGDSCTAQVALLCPVDFVLSCT